jgi:hypothetical protein
VCDETGHVQSDEADKSAISPEFHGEQPKSALAKVLLNAIHTLIAFCAR